MYESSVYKSKVDLTAWGISFTYIKNKKGPKIDPCGIPQEIFPKSKELTFNIKKKYFLRKVRSKPL